MAMPRLPQTLQTSLGQTTSRCQRLYSSSSSCSFSTTTTTTAAAVRRTPLLINNNLKSNKNTSALGQCRIVTRTKHHLTGTNATETTTTTARKGYSSLATASHSHTPPPSITNANSAANAGRPYQQEQQQLLHRSKNQQSSKPIHIASSTFPSMPNSNLNATPSAAATTTVSPQSSPLFRMNNPASIVKQPQARRRYSPQHFYQNRILDPYVHQAVSPITLRQLVFFGRNMQEDKLLKSANYVRTELPIRLAHRIRDFQNLPFIAFERLVKIPEIKTLEENDAFCEMVKGLLNDHLVVIPQLALGIMECSKHIPAAQIDQFMNKMLRSRISRRVLAEQHITLTANFNSPNHMMTDRGYIGIIYTHIRPKDIVERTAALAADTCRQASGGMNPPKVMLDGNIDAEFTYIPDHIEYILYELLKNSMRFVMQNGKRDPATGDLPPIQVTVCEGTHEIVFRVSDKGGGIHPEMESQLWSYAQSPARFANFEKISKMAATVQEQVTPSSPSSPSTSFRESDDGQDQDDNIVLPPPPAANKNSTYQPSESTLLLDRHAPTRGQSSQKSSFSTTATASSHQQYKNQSLHLGIGLPMSRVYAEYWGGDLKVFTMHGYGTDAYAKFCKFGNIYENFDV
ncbi:hypothetical protein BGZ95_010385 [Linnemannia exigua]|uniref:Protein-serine/threonine kinase n=1 Tax=Linnemannia exigua TaxID=604196 RepID=A0AAD4DBG0_9FUNG|nr:hypothetical protein BGZ95_010385 [Linnemannia exigua]